MSASSNARRPKLAGTMFQKDLGSLLDKTVRVEKLVAPLAELTGLAAKHAGALGHRQMHPCMPRLA